MPFIKAAAVVIALCFSITSVWAGAAGSYKRPNGKTAKVWMCGGKLCASSGGTNMFLGGLRKSGKNRWSGKMKHPEMPSFMTFNGSAKLSGKKMIVRGCMVGQSGCKAETWRK